MRPWCLKTAIYLGKNLLLGGSLLLSNLLNTAFLAFAADEAPPRWAMLRRTCADFFKRMRQIHQDSFYNDHRDLEEYTYFFGHYFDAAVSALRAHEVWLDSGAGAGTALMQYLEQYPAGGKVVGTGLRLKDADRARWEEGRQRYPHRMSYQVGPMEHGPPARWQIFGEHYQLITDVFGPIVYTHRPDRLVRRYGELLIPGGFLMLIIDVNNLLIVDRWKVRWPLQDWILAWRGFELVEDPLFFQASEAIFLPVILRRTFEEVAIPPLKPLMDCFQVGCPPQRAFMWEDLL